MGEPKPDGSPFWHSHPMEQGPASAAALDEARARSKGVWDEMAAGWQLHNDVIWEASRQVGEWLVDKVAPQPGQTILELAAGPGDTGFVAARLVGEGGRLISTDFSPNMVDVAAARARSIEVSNAEFRVMDAEDIDLGDDTVDGILCRFGFMLMLDPQAALAECRRVLRPGRRLAFAVWTGPEKNPWVAIIGMVLRQQGYEPPGDPFGPGGIFSMGSEEQVRKRVTRAGFEEVETEEMEVHWRFEDFAGFWTFLTELAGGIAVFIRALKDGQRHELRRGVEKAIEGFRTGRGYELPGVALNVAAS